MNEQYKGSNIAPLVRMLGSVHEVRSLDRYVKANEKRMNFHLQVLGIFLHTLEMLINSKGIENF